MKRLATIDMRDLYHAHRYVKMHKEIEEGSNAAVFGKRCVGDGVCKMDEAYWKPPTVIWIGYRETFH